MRRIILIVILLFTVQNLAAQDSLLLDSNVVVEVNSYSPTLFNPSNISVNRIVAPQNSKAQSQHLFWLLLVISVFGVILWRSAQTYTFNLLKSNFNSNHAIQMARSERSNDKLYAWLYLVLFAVVMTLSLVFGVERIAGIQVKWLYVFGGIVGYVCYELLLSSVSGYLLKQKAIARTANYRLFAAACLVLIIMLPLLALLIFGAKPLQWGTAWLVVILTCLLLLLKEIRFIHYLLQERMAVNKFYFFLYICTFKFLPIVLVTKALYNMSSAL